MLFWFQSHPVGIGGFVALIGLTALAWALRDKRDPCRAFDEEESCD